jgi:tetratricopeptide (TPR) repeat protein
MRIQHKSPVESKKELSIIEKSKGLIKKVNELIAEGRNAEAINHFNKAINYLESHKNDISQNNKDISGMYNDLALVLVKVNKPSEALKIFDKALHWNPKNVRVLINKGKTLTFLSASMYNNALKSFNSALKIDPTNKMALSLKGEGLVKMNQPEMAKECYLGIIDNYPMELEFYDRILKLTPKDKSIWERKGEALCKEKRYEEALTCYNTALDIDPNDKQLYIGRARIFGKLKKYTEAILCFRKGIKIDEKDKTLWQEMGLMHHKNGEFENALDAYDHAIKLDSEDPDLWNKKGAAFLKMKRTDDALKSYENALNLAPDDIHILNNMKEPLKALQRYVDVLSICDKIIKLDPNNIQALNDKAKTLVSMGKPKEAIEYFDTVLKIDSKYMDALFCKKDVHIKLKNHEEVNLACDTILKNDPKNVRIWEDKAFALRMLEKYIEANSAYESALAIEPENLKLWTAKKGVLKSLGRYIDVLSAAEKILLYEPHNIMVLMDKGEAYENLKNYDEAHKIYDMILDSNPGDTQVLYKKGRILCRKGLYEESLKHFDKILKMGKGDKTLWNDKGRLLNKMGQFEEARKSYDIALQLDPENTKILINKTFSLFKLNEYDEAIESLNRAMELSKGKDDPKEGIKNTIYLEIDVFINITQAIVKKDIKKNCMDLISRAKEAVKRGNFEKSQEFCMECKRIIDEYTKNALEKSDFIISALKEMEGETSKFETMYNNMKTKLENKKYSEAYPLSEKIIKDANEEQHKIISSILNNARDKIKDARNSQLDVSAHIKKFSEARALVGKKSYKNAYDLIMVTLSDIDLMIEKQKELLEGIKSVKNKIEEAQSSGIEIKAVVLKFKEAEEALKINNFEIVSNAIEECNKVLVKRTIEHAIDEKIVQIKELLDVGLKLKINTSEIDSQLETIDLYLKKEELEKALSSVNNAHEMAEKLCNLKIMEMLTQIRSRINEVKKLGWEAQTAEVIFKKVEEVHLSQRYNEAAKYALRCLSEVDEIRDESMRAGNLILLAESNIKEAENINAFVERSKELLDLAKSDLAANNYSSSLENASMCMVSVKKAKEQKVKDVIAQAWLIIDDSKKEGKEIFNAEMMLKEAEIVVGYEDYYKALKLALRGEHEVGKTDYQLKILSEILVRIKLKIDELEKLDIVTKMARSHLLNSQKAQKKNEYITALDYAILASKALTEIIYNYEKAKIFLRVASARISEVEKIGLDTKEIKEIFEKAKKEFNQRDYAGTIKLVKENIDGAKKLYSESLLEPIKLCEKQIEFAEKLGADVVRANIILLEAKAAFDEELFSQVPLFIDNCKKLVEREIKVNLFDKLTQTREKLEMVKGKGVDTKEAEIILNSGESALENKNFQDAVNHFQKCIGLLEFKGSNPQNDRENSPEF